MSENNQHIFKRLWIYQKERFPLIVNLIAVTTFTFSAISYSRICRDMDGFVDLGTFLIGCFATFTLFFLVRVFDEFKDQEDDLKYRSYLPVPRGLIKLSELRNLGIIIGIAQIAVIAYFQLPMLWLYALVIVYLCLMGVEFFVGDWLKEHQILYITSHMIIIPLLDIYSSGLDWLLAGTKPHWGLAFFFIVSYMNGLIGEFGRKMKAKEDEEEGVTSYTGMWGISKAVNIWIACIFFTLIVASLAAYFAGYGLITFSVLLILGFTASLAGIKFKAQPSKKSAKLVEAASGIWIIGMYLSLGGIPMIIDLIG